MIYIAIINLLALGFVGGFIAGGCWVCAIQDASKREHGPPVRWAPDEYEIIKRQSKDFADAPWTHPEA